VRAGLSEPPVGRTARRTACSDFTKVSKAGARTNGGQMGMGGVRSRLSHIFHVWSRAGGVAFPLRLHMFPQTGLMQAPTMHQYRVEPRMPFRAALNRSGRAAGGGGCRAARALSRAWPGQPSRPNPAPSHVAVEALEFRTGIEKPRNAGKHAQMVQARGRGTAENGALPWANATRSGKQTGLGNGLAWEGTESL
jgi:hypothetical protein